MKKIIGLSLLLLTGCMPLKQIEWHTSTQEIGISPESDEIHVNARTQTKIDAQKPTIDTNRSFATSPSDQRLSLSVRKNDFSAKYESFWTADYVRIIDPHNPKRYLKWKNGEWKLDLFFVGPNPRDPIHSEFKLWTFWYCPLIHGAPN